MQLCSGLGGFLGVFVITGRAEVQMTGATFELEGRSSASSLCTAKRPG